MNELAAVKSDGSVLQPIYDTGSGVLEVWMGNWSSDGTWIIYTEIWYGIVDGQIDEINLNIVQIRLSDAYRFYAVSDQVSMLPNWQLMDPDPPVSFVTHCRNILGRQDLTLKWFGMDYGPSGVYGYDIQTRTGTNQSWLDWLSGTQATSSQFTGAPGDTVYFRSRAIDYAANQEAWACLSQRRQVHNALHLVPDWQRDG